MLAVAYLSAPGDPAKVLIRSDEPPIVKAVFVPFAKSGSGSDAAS
jgi:hypothetical protein